MVLNMALKYLRLQLPSYTCSDWREEILHFMEVAQINNKTGNALRDTFAKKLGIVLQAEGRIVLTEAETLSGLVCEEY
jgi:hypothetical protein